MLTIKKENLLFLSGLMIVIGVILIILQAALTTQGSPSDPIFLYRLGIIDGSGITLTILGFVMNFVVRRMS